MPNLDTHQLVSHGHQQTIGSNAGYEAKARLEDGKLADKPGWLASRVSQHPIRVYLLTHNV